MYARYYMEARDLAEKIRQGQYQTREQPTVEPTGFMEKPTKPQPRPERAPQETMIEYMAMVQDSFSSPSVGKVPVQGEVKTALEALAAVESRGSGDYSALGPVLEKGSYKGDRAYGRYQVMGKNIPSWTKQALGVSMTPEEFLQSPEAQDAVAAYRMQKYYDKHGSWEDAASVWFTGQPLKKASTRGANDGYIGVNDYVRKFRANWSDS